MGVLARDKRGELKLNETGELRQREREMGKIKRKEKEKKMIIIDARETDRDDNDKGNLGEIRKKERIKEKEVLGESFEGKQTNKQ